MCHLELWVQTWLQNNQLTSHSCVVKSQPVKRFVGNLLGGLVPSHLNEDVQKAVVFAVDAYNDKSNSAFRSVAKTVSHVYRQVTCLRKEMFDLTMH